MAKFNVKEIRKMAEEDFEKAWIETGKLVKIEGRNINWVEGKGKTHPVIDLALKFRETLLSLGFDEVLNPSIVEEGEVYRQYGPEAPIILDRCFYLATLPRPDIGISKEKIGKIKSLIPEFNEDNVTVLKKIFREYKEGKIESDNLVEEIVDKLSVKPETATSILKIFPEFLQLKPLSSKLILRSHMTALWFPVLANIKDKLELPVKLFSIGLKFRREQSLDFLHLYESHVASLVVMAENISLEDGMELTKIVLSKLGFNDVKFIIKKATSKYYAPQTEAEVFIKFNGEWVEVGDEGLYSPVALANYGVEYPVFNAGFGIERLAMIITGENDIRRLAYPHFYLQPEYSDLEIAKMVEIDEKPKTLEGEKVKNAIVQAFLRYGEEKGPCQFLVYEDKLLGRNVKVYVYESDVNAKLLGPAALNIIYVYQGNILGIPEKGFEKEKLVLEAREKGVSTGITYLEAIASMAAARLEKMVEEGSVGELNLRVKVVKHPSDVNIKIKPQAERYITSKNKKIIVKGPVFLGVKIQVS
ncbi:MAG: O-phosphoserine--tRNA ligase [Candidatus Bathyarchaeota archaeon]